MTKKLIAKDAEATCVNHGCRCRGRANPGDGSSAHGLARRDFLKLAGVTGVAAGVLPPWQLVMAGPFTRDDFEKLVPADKKLSPGWVKSLFERGQPEVWRGNELKFIGMPVGGIGTGQLYLGGDGRIWHWDIFNAQKQTGDSHYRTPLEPASPVEQAFTIELRSGEHLQKRQLRRGEWSDISFRGEYPIGRVEYADPGSPVSVVMEAFSPFIPLNADDSSLPATIVEFSIKNTSATVVEVLLRAELGNSVCLSHRQQEGRLRNSLRQIPGGMALVCSAERVESSGQQRPDIVFEDWQHSEYAGWRVEGTAFGTGPIDKSAMPAYQGDVGGDSQRVVNSHATAPGDSVAAKDSATGKLTSREFTIERNFIAFWIGGGTGASNARLGLTLFVTGKPVQTVVGQNDNHMAAQTFDVRAYAGQTGHIEILDDAKGGWGNIGVGRIVFTDHPSRAQALERLPDYGTMALTLVGERPEESGPEGTVPFGQELLGWLGRALKIAPGQTATTTFVLTWHFPNLSLSKLGLVGRHYATRFTSAIAVSEYVVANQARLAQQTRMWRDTWYDSTLPFWFLDRTFLNASILATSTTFRFGSGRYYGWEGVGCCEGTCGHVYHYAHAAARLFPELERGTREQVDFGLAQAADGAIHFRGEFNDFPAVDGQAGAILRALREHQMSADAAFLKQNWPRIKLATQWLIARDGNGDGLIETNQHNTLDTDWYGKVAWLSGLYLAALTAAAAMADEAGDASFAEQCRAILEAGRNNMVTELFDGEYFVNRVDPKHLDAINSGTGCEIDQVFGQSWAFQVGLPRVLSQKETVSALKALWRYNFTPDVGPYRAANKPGRWYAMPGEAGLLMCSFPRTDWDYARAKGKGPEWAAGYFNECMNGFEYQVAGHMLREGMALEGLAVTRAVHDRYHPSRRNPWNEIECGDHYARSMASYGVYLAACGFEYHGPKRHIGFAPRLTPEQFRCAFTAAEGWGTYSQRAEPGSFIAELVVRWGKLKVQTIALEAGAANSVQVRLNGYLRPAKMVREERRVLITLASPVEIQAGGLLRVSLA